MRMIVCYQSSCYQCDLPLILTIVLDCYLAMSWAVEEVLSIVTPELGGDMLYRFKDRTTLG